MVRTISQYITGNILQHSHRWFHWHDMWELNILALKGYFLHEQQTDATFQA